MKSKVLWQLVALLVVLSMALTACQPAAAPAAEPEKPAAEPTKAPEAAPAQAEPTKAPEAAPAEAEEFIFGIVMVGPYNDNGWNTAHFEAGKYLEAKVPGAKMIYIDKANSADRPGTTPAQLAEDLLSKGAKLIIFNSDDMKDSAVEFAKAHPDLPVIHASGDSVWKDGKNYVELPNMTNIMGEMEYGKMIAGCAAAMTTKTGQIGYLGPLINDETRRLVSASYLGAKHCWTTYRGMKAEDLKFKVTWIGFWFNIPGFTSDPTQVANDFFNSGYDVIMSGIDTTEALTEAAKAADAGKEIWAVPYDFKDACKEAEKVCLGVPYFNWGPNYLKAVNMILDGSYTGYFEWVSPDWTDINNPDTSIVGFVNGPALSAEGSDAVGKFVAELAGGLNLWKGPLNLQDGTEYVKDGETATPQQIWYLEQLLEGIEGQSVAQ